MPWDECPTGGWRGQRSPVFRSRSCQAWIGVSQRVGQTWLKQNSMYVATPLRWTWKSSWPLGPSWLPTWTLPGQLLGPQWTWPLELEQHYPSGGAALRASQDVYWLWGQGSKASFWRGDERPPLFPQPQLHPAKDQGERRILHACCLSRSPPMRKVP